VTEALQIRSTTEGVCYRCSRRGSLRMEARVGGEEGQEGSISGATRFSET
jgi:hypothetical protein